MHRSHPQLDGAGEKKVAFTVEDVAAVTSDILPTGKSGRTDDSCSEPVPTGFSANTFSGGPIPTAIRLRRSFRPRCPMREKLGCGGLFPPSMTGVCYLTRRSKKRFPRHDGAAVMHGDRSRAFFLPRGRQTPFIKPIWAAASLAVSGVGRSVGPRRPRKCRIKAGWSASFRFTTAKRKLGFRAASGLFDDFIARQLR